MTAWRVPSGTGSRRKHARACRCLRGRADAYEVPDDAPVKWCRLCEPAPVCTRCLDTPAQPRVLDCHPMCAACAVDLAAFNVANGRPVLLCSCAGAALNLDALPPPQRAQVARMNANALSVHRAPTGWEDALVDRCPTCGTAFHGFEGCLALRCHACGAFFCALCHQVSAGNAEAHLHVLACDLNDVADYFWPTAKFLAFQSARADARLGAWMRAVPVLTAASAVLASRGCAGHLPFWSFVATVWRILSACVASRARRSFAWMRRTGAWLRALHRVPRAWNGAPR